MKILNKSFLNTLSNDSVLVRWVFLRGLALIYLSAFASMSTQIKGLVGANGILPAISKLAIIEQFYQQQKFWHTPTIFWFQDSDFMLSAVCYAGMAASCLLLLNIFNRAALIVCYMLYLSIVQIGQDFTLFQWDIFLLETGFLAIFLTWGSGIVILLYSWLLARFMFMGGVVKLASGDPNWANLSALQFHYETQPLPSPIAYYAHQLPEWVNKLCVGGVFFIELIVPFFVFLPRPFQVFACASFVLLQSSIMLTGNYNFFNLLTILLCLFLLRDNDIAKLLPAGLISRIRQEQALPGPIAHTCAGLWAGIVMLVCASQIWLYNANTQILSPLKDLLRISSTFSLVNNYGPFAVMTTKRHEIIVQGSNDAVNWTDYQFKYKPGRLDLPLGWNIPHQPRLDWQMWFEALDPKRRSTWFDNFLMKLLEGSPQVLSLLNNDPFPEKPPRYIRALIYRYSFTSQEQRNHTGQTWKRQDPHIYAPEKSLFTTVHVQQSHYR